MQLVFATNNQNKLNEVQALVPDHIQLLSLKDIQCFEDIDLSYTLFDPRIRY